MDDKSAFFDFHRNENNNIPASEQTSQTDYTEVASCIFPDESKEAKNREIRAEKVREYIAAEKIRPLPIGQKILRLLGLKHSANSE